jgi:hypothetical protein
MRIIGASSALLRDEDVDAQGFQQQASTFTAASFSGLYGLNTTVFTRDQSGVVYEPPPRDRLNHGSRCKRLRPDAAVLSQFGKHYPV